MTVSAAKKNRLPYRPFLESERLILREVRVSDVTDEYYQWLNDPEVGRYLETHFRPQSKEMIEAYVRQMQNSSDSAFFAIIEKSKKRHIGNIKIGPINWHHSHADISLVVGRKASWGQGFATEAIKLVTDFGFNSLNLHKLCAGAYGVNVGSSKAFEKAGFVIEGKRRQHRFCEGRYVDEVLLGRVRKERLS